MIDAALLEQLTITAKVEGVQQFVVGAVVSRGDTVLLLKRPSDDFMGGIYELPSGKVEPDEELVEALVREVKEESGLDISSIRGYIGSFDYTSGSGKKSRQFNFAVDVETNKPITLTEHDAYLWAELGEKVPVTEAVKDVLGAYQRPRSR
jgi:8-oxo-dGTP diphosphatase